MCLGLYNVSYGSWSVVTNPCSLHLRREHLEYEWALHVNQRYEGGFPGSPGHTYM